MLPGATLYQRPVELLQRFIRFDTTNPPGNEVECIRFINDLLKGTGCSTQIIAKDPLRPNLLTRLSGKGEAPPLLLYNHVDVVTTENQEWENDPFGGEIGDGFVWGCGALDMNSGVAMMLAAVTDARFFSRLGIQTYGFTPMQLPPGMDFAKIAHGANERIPVEAVSFGADAIYQVLQRFHG